jgi:ribosomal protein L14E/L6E/L27E
MTTPIRSCPTLRDKVAEKFVKKTKKDNLLSKFTYEEKKDFAKKIIEKAKRDANIVRTHPKTKEGFEEMKKKGVNFAW